MIVECYGDVIVFFRNGDGEVKRLFVGVKIVV